MTTLDELSKNIEAMSMSSILTDIATPPPPPPPLEIERWRTLSKSYKYDNLIFLNANKTSSYNWRASPKICDYATQHAEVESV